MGCQTRSTALPLYSLLQYATPSGNKQHPVLEQFLTNGCFCVAIDNSSALMTTAASSSRHHKRANETGRTPLLSKIGSSNAVMLSDKLDLQSHIAVNCHGRLLVDLCRRCDLMLATG